jgi:hypothetical protein
LSDDPAKNYSQQVRLDPVTEERAEIIDISDWRETLLRLCKTPTASVWMQAPN